MDLELHARELQRDQGTPDSWGDETAPGSGAFVARVEEVRDWRIDVRDLRGGQRRTCAVLDAALEASPVAANDLVLVQPVLGVDFDAVVVGRIADGRPAATRRADEAPVTEALTPDHVVLQAKQSLTLRAGEASITMRDDGKILIKGHDVVSHAKRTNRIKGGSVAIN
jgi:hypothetical protein